MTVFSAHGVPYLAQAATIAPLSRREKNTDAGEARRRKLATVLGVSGGIGSVLVMKSAATALALSFGAPALLVAGAGVAATMAAAGSVDYMFKRAALKRAGQEVPRFSLRQALFSKASLMAGGMTTLAAFAPAAAVLAVGSAVAGISAGAHGYFSRRREAKAAGKPVEPFSFRSMFSDINNSREAKKAFVISAVLGAVLSALIAALTGVSAPVANPSASGVVTDEFNRIAAAHEAWHPSADLSASQATAEVPAPVVEAPATAYEVQKGDTLWEVARQVAGDNASRADISKTMQDIAAFNQIDNVNHIQAGDTLKLPVTAEDMEQVARLRDDMLAAKVQVVASPATSAPSEIIFDTVADKNGTQQFLYSNGIVETRTPIFAEAAASSASVNSVPTQGSTVGTCTFTEQPKFIQNNCVLDPHAVMKPGSSIAFNTATDPEPFLVTLSQTSAPTTVGEFLANHALPEAEEAYSNGSFKPQP